jgi:ribose transport system substrate-binding protein
MNRNARNLSILTAVLVLAAPAAAVAQDGAELTDGSGFKVGFSQANNGDVWRINQTSNVEQYCKEYMPLVEVIVTDAQGDNAKQDADIDSLLAQEIDVLLLTPNEATPLTPAAQRALDAGVPVITLDREVDIPVTQHIGADNELIGRTAAQFVAETLLGGEGGTVLEIQGTAAASATIDRNEQFVAWLAENAPEVQILDSQIGDYRRENALVVMNDWLQRFPPGEVDVVYTHNDEMALGAVQALEQGDRADDMAVVGIDGQNEAIQAIADGRIAATFTYDNAGKEACESAQLLLSGQEIEPVWVLETNQIDQANAEEWIGMGF